MKSVGTRTTLPRAPPTSRRGPTHRSCSSERRRPAPAPAPPSETTEAGPPAMGGAAAPTDPSSPPTPPPLRSSPTATGCPPKTSGGGGPVTQYREGPPVAKTDNHNPPKILPVSGKLEQNNAGLVRPSAFKPVVPKSFHSMQNLVGQSGGRWRGRNVAGGGAGPQAAAAQGAVLPQRRGPRGAGQPRRGRGGGGGAAARGPEGARGPVGLRAEQPDQPAHLLGLGFGYAPPRPAPLSASTSHINRLGTSAAAPPLEKPGYQNGLSASDSGRSSSGKSSSSYQRLSHLGDAPLPLRPSPSSDDVIQDLEDRLWEKEQEVLHMRRNLDQSEAAIVQVFEEKQRVWERDMEELRQNYAARLQQVSRRAQRMQQALQAQIARLQQDKRRLQDEIAALLAHREDLERKCLDYRKEQADILPRLEETKWEVRRRGEGGVCLEETKWEVSRVGLPGRDQVGGVSEGREISLLKQQLRESQAEVTQRAGEMVALRGQLKEVSAQLREREELVLGLKDSYSNKSLKLEHCQGELKRTLTEVSLLRDK
ncbi:hypothetical protein ANANG_G00198410 [Anguilla anguilla]|uniref:Leucine zipper tumor suppressor 3 n=1 Tax=Anguilla anguilla TaxID=7936 RepID=A0A9D3RVV2_ANGAN|nr:hypothetical protein ANANG_G00198410 [Anguilla anguilla]